MYPEIRDLHSYVHKVKAWVEGGEKIVLPDRPKRGAGMSEQAVCLENWDVVNNPWKIKRYLHGEVYGPKSVNALNENRSTLPCSRQFGRMGDERACFPNSRLFVQADC